MRVRRTLQLQAGLSVFAALALLLMLVLSLHRIRGAMEGVAIAGDIISNAFENSAFRNDYLQSGGERAREQWFATHGRIRALLSEADKLEWSQDDIVLLVEIEHDNESSLTLFSAIVAGRKDRQGEGGLQSVERENRLLTQLVIRSYDTVNHARRLQESSREHLFSVIMKAGWGLVWVLSVTVLALVISSLSITRLLAERITTLQSGTAAVGEGRLDFRFDLQGDDEFVQLAKAFDGMTARLDQSHRDLERENRERRLVEDALQESELRFRGIFENAAVGITLLDPGGRLIQANAKFYEIIGYSENELVGHSFHCITYPEDFEPDRGRYEQLMSGALKSYEVEKRYLRKDGRPVWVRLARSAQPGDRGLPAHSIAVVQDVTERKEAEEALRNAEKMLRTVLESLPVGVWILDRAGRIIHANPAAHAIWAGARLPGPELVPEYKGWWPDSGARIEPDEWAGVMAVSRGATVLNREIEIECFDGSHRTILDSAVPIINEQGQIGGAVTVNQDISDRKRAEEVIRQREEQLNLFVEHAPAAIAMFDCEMRYLSASRRWIDVFRIQEVDLRGALHYDVFPEIPEKWKEYHQRGLAGEVLRADAEPLVRQNGAVQWVRWELRPWFDRSGRVAGIMIFVEDMTEAKLAEDQLRRAKDELEVRVRERTEELSRALEGLRSETAERLQAVEELRRNEQMLMQQARLAAMGEMLANIAHQWRQPLNVLSIILQDLTRSYDRGRFSREMLGASVNRGRELISHMSQTIDDFRHFLNPEKIRTRFDVREVVEKVIAMVGASLRDIRIDLQAAGEPVMVEGHRNEFAQVIINILMNARDALHERKVEAPAIRVAVHGSRERTVVTIADNAGGIADNLLDKVFDPYFTTKGPDKGTGIGLFMSKTIVERTMGGRLTVRNVLNGAEFRIEI